MFGPITVPYDSVMLWNVCTLKDGVNFVDVEEAIGVVCNTSKEESHGFICGQVFSYADFLVKRDLLWILRLKKLVIIFFWSHIGEIL